MVFTLLEVQRLLNLMGEKKHEITISSIKLPHVILLTSTYILLAQMARKIHHRIKLLHHLMVNTWSDPHAVI